MACNPIGVSASEDLVQSCEDLVPRFTYSVDCNKIFVHWAGDGEPTSVVYELYRWVQVGLNYQREVIATIDTLDGFFDCVPEGNWSILLTACIGRRQIIQGGCNSCGNYVVIEPTCCKQFDICNCLQPCTPPAECHNGECLEPVTVNVSCGVDCDALIPNPVPLPANNGNGGITFTVNEIVVTSVDNCVGSGTFEECGNATYSDFPLTGETNQQTIDRLTAIADQNCLDSLNPCQFVATITKTANVCEDGYVPQNIVIVGTSNPNVSIQAAVDEASNDWRTQYAAYLLSPPNPCLPDTVTLRVYFPGGSGSFVGLTGSYTSGFGSGVLSFVGGCVEDAGLNPPMDYCEAQVPKGASVTINTPAISPNNNNYGEFIGWSNTLGNTANTPTSTYIGDITGLAPYTDLAYSSATPSSPVNSASGFNFTMPLVNTNIEANYNFYSKAVCRSNDGGVEFTSANCETTLTDINSSVLTPTFKYRKKLNDSRLDPLAANNFDFVAILFSGVPINYNFNTGACVADPVCVPPRRGLNFPHIKQLSNPVTDTYTLPNGTGSPATYPCVNWGTLQTDSNYKFNPDLAFTISFWIYINKFPTGESNGSEQECGALIFGKATDGTGSPFFLIQMNGDLGDTTGCHSSPFDKTLNIRWTGVTDTYAGKIPFASLPLKKWCHFTFIYDPSNTQASEKIRTYLNGFRIVSQIQGSPVPVNDFPIGSALKNENAYSGTTANVSALKYSNFVLGDLRVFQDITQAADKSILTEAEINILYNNGNTLKTIPNGIKTVKKLLIDAVFDQTTGTSVPSADGLYGGTLENYIDGVNTTEYGAQFTIPHGVDPVDVYHFTNIVNVSFVEGTPPFTNPDLSRHAPYGTKGKESNPLAGDKKLPAWLKI